MRFNGLEKALDYGHILKASPYMFKIFVWRPACVGIERPVQK